MNKTWNPLNLIKVASAKKVKKKILPGRPNTNGVDLNRNFPTWSELELDTNQLFQGRELETQALMRWIMDNPFVLSINFHDGSTVVSDLLFPFDCVTKYFISLFCIVEIEFIIGIRSLLNSSIE